MRVGDRDTWFASKDGSVLFRITRRNQDGSMEVDCDNGGWTGVFLDNKIRVGSDKEWTDCPIFWSGSRPPGRDYNQRIEWIKTQGRQELIHPSHTTRDSDASSFDEVCIICGGTDRAGSFTLEDPCGQPRPKTFEEWLEANADKLSGMSPEASWAEEAWNAALRSVGIKPQ